MNTHSMKVCVHSESHTNLKGPLVISAPSSSSVDRALKRGMCLLYTCAQGSDWNTWVQLTGAVSQYFWRWANTSVSCCHRSMPTFKTTYKPSEHTTHICYDHLTYSDKSQIKDCRIIYLSHSCCCWLRDLICLNWEKLCKLPRLLLHHSSSSSQNIWTQPLCSSTKLICFCVHKFVKKRSVNKAKSMWDASKHC